MNFLEFLSLLTWPLVVAGAIYYLRDSLIGLIDGIKMLRIKAGNNEVELTRREATHALEEMVQDVVSLVDGLNEEELSLYLSIRSADGRKKVNEYFTDFSRDSKEHQMLRSLRDRKLIRPFEGSKWEPNKHPVTTRFATYIEKIAPDILRKI